MDAARDNARSFGHQWGVFDHDRDRAWGATLDERLAAFLHDVDLSPDELEGLSVLYAGSGTGTLAAAAARTGARVTGLEISAAVHEAAARFPNVEFVQGDVTRPPFAPARSTSSTPAASSTTPPTRAPRSKLCCPS